MREKIGTFDFLRLVRVLDKLEWITDDDIVAIERLAGGAENMDNFIQNFSKEDIEKLRRTDEELADFIEDIEKLNEIVDQILSLSPRINPTD